MRIILAASVVFALTFVVDALQTRPDAAMASAAKALIAAVGETPAKAKLVWAFDSEERFNWHFIPRPRKGLPLFEMAAPQRNLAHALLAAGLSQQGYIKATTIMSLDDILRIMEKDATGRRNADGYYFSVFGEPGENNVWAYRVEGHHVRSEEHTSELQSR